MELGSGTARVRVRANHGALQADEREEEHGPIGGHAQLEEERDARLWEAVGEEEANEPVSHDRHETDDEAARRVGEL